MDTNESKKRRPSNGVRRGRKTCDTLWPISEIQDHPNLDHEMNPMVKTESENFFCERADPKKEALAMATHVICRLLIWMADGRTLEARGLRASVALFCIRPDLIDDATLERIGALAGCSRQAVHKLAVDFRETTGLHA